MRQQYKLGQYFRRRYGKIIGEKYSSNDIYVHSTDYDRTIMSAQANLAGLYHPSKDSLWNDTILWRPIPVHTIPPKYDHAMFGPHADCPDFDKEFKKYENECPEVQRIYSENKELFLYWSKMSGGNITTINDVASLFRTFNIENLHGKK